MIKNFIDKFSDEDLISLAESLENPVNDGKNLLSKLYEDYGNNQFFVFALELGCIIAVELAKRYKSKS